MTQFSIAGLVAALTLVTMLGAPALTAADETFKARLHGFQEVPAVSTEASGEFRARISEDETSIEYELSYANLQGTVTQGHIHFGQLSVNGGIVVWLCQTATNRDPTGLAPECPQSGTVAKTITAANVVATAVAQGIVGSSTGATPEEFAEFVKALRAGVTYANVHTSSDVPGQGFPAGEIRGQIRRGGGDKD
jgi:CHRD domain